MNRIGGVAALVVTVFALATSSLADDHAAIRKIDLGAVTASGKIDEDIAVATAGQPDEASLEVLSEAGFTTIIDLRGPNERRGIEEQEVVEGLGMSYIALPVTSRDDLSFETASELDALLAEANGPVLIHCGSGNRVGALLALRASLNGASDEEALELGRKAGLTGSEGVVTERLESPED